MNKPAKKKISTIVLMMGLCAVLAMAPGASADESAKAEKVNAVAKNAFAEMPGKYAFVFTQIVDGKPKVLFGHNEDERFAVGSSFKLYILGALADEVNANRRRLDNVMLLERELEGPPSSEMGDWPAGSPVTLHTLALKMNAISDNTATDHLLYLLGKERVEAQMKEMGHGKPEVNIPLLSTREMTSLRDKKAGMPAKEYQELDVAGKRKFLAEKFTGVPDYEKLDFDTAAYDQAEWYASPVDMAHALAWLEENTKANQPANPIRGILAMDVKLKFDAKEWLYVGFKGGSEDQILAGNWLLQNKNGQWYTYHVYCNSPKEPVKPEVFVKAAVKLFDAISQELK